jgi:predicted NAD-dependent protein-ADP-ribosyltransferase YbiA (DUF1768 family)
MKQYIYTTENSITFRKSNEEFGCLSNMCSGYPIILNDVTFLTSEALYQSLRFPEFPDIQKEIISAKSPMTAKEISRKYLYHTGNKFIVEDSYKDNYWGAIKTGNELKGSNYLGRLLMQLRTAYNEDKESVKTVTIPKIENILIYSKSITV